MSPRQVAAPPTPLSPPATTSLTAFLAALQADDRALLEGCDRALRAPVWPLFLGRRSFVPGRPVPIPGGGVRDTGDLMEALCAEPLFRRPREKPEERLRCVVEVNDLDAEVRRDQPLSFQNGERSFALRYVEDRWIESANLTVEGVPTCTSAG